MLRAIDPKTGKEVWRYNNYAPLWGGVLATKGNLVFTGNPEGYLMAFDAKTGKKSTSSTPVRGRRFSGYLGDGWRAVRFRPVRLGWCGPLWGGEVAKRIKEFNQGGMVWTFKLPKDLVAKR